ncbi:MAG: MBL fold metallo-hydrolase [Treponemataceae bacterium]
MKRGLISLVFTLAVAAPTLFAGGSAEEVRDYDGMVIGDPVITTSTDGKTIVSVEMLTQGKKITLKTNSFESAKAAALVADLKQGNLVDYRKSGEMVLIPVDAASAFHKVLAKNETKEVAPDPNASYIYSMKTVQKKGPKETQFDTMKYGPELSPINGTAGNMVAAGWVYAKTGKTITIGDGRLVTEDISGRPLPSPSKRYEETYNVADDVAVYHVNTDDYSKSTVSDFASIPLAANYDYATKNRQAVFVVFDKNYTQAAAAKVSAVYYFTPQSVTDGKPVWDVQTRSSCLNDKGTDPVSGKPYVSINATSVIEAPHTRSTEPFEIVKNTFYYIGDNEVAVYLFNADMGTKDTADDRLIMVDAGWPYNGYQYWKNIEALGFDPRKITDIMLTHGHMDHYGTVMELVTMIENAGRKVTLYGSRDDTFGLTKDGMGNSWNIKGALPADEMDIRKKTSIMYEFDTYMDFGNVRILVTPTPGHTPGTGSFVFKVKNPDSAEWVSFGYMGGYGFNGLYTPNPSNGFLRLGFQLGLAWLQQMVDVDYVAPQHTNQYPIVDVYQALKAYNNDPTNAGKPLTMLDALGKNEFVNFLEKRYSVVTNIASDINDSRYKSVETSGPFKPGREYGSSNVKATLLDGGKIIRGFNGVMNVAPQIPLLKDGILNNTDVYTKDPDAYYVQFYIDVLDDYRGFLPAGGPVESMRSTPGTPEILRTQRLDSKADAEAILASVKKGETYLINLTAASAIFVPRNAAETFRPAR